MKFVETPLQGAYVIEFEEIRDNRGFFGRSFCAREFEERGLKGFVAQSNVSFNTKKGTMRGMHWAVRPAAESKLVRCTAGAVHDVIVDLRPDSPSYLQHFAVELSGQNRRSLYIPELFAHGFLTLADNSEVMYLHGDFYQPGHERGLRYDDPQLGIKWPGPVEVIADKDLKWAPFAPE